MGSSELSAQNYALLAEREAANIPDIASDTGPLPVNSVGIVGAGTMGGGIAISFLNAGLPVTLADANRQALDRGVANIRKTYESAAARGRLTPEDVLARMQLLTPTLDLADLKQTDLIIEAVFESMPLKKDVFAKLDAIARPGAILATNTSLLNVNEIASATRRSEAVIGMHFFSPANVMRLLEVVRGEASDKAVVATAMQLAKRLGKIAVLAGVCHGFIANRLMLPRRLQADGLMLAGTTPSQIDRVMREYGFAVGPFQMSDIVGLDVGGRDSNARTIRGDMVKNRRLGQKGGGGFYDYDDDRRPIESDAAKQIIAAFVSEMNIEQSGPLADEEILARLLYPVVNEGVRILEDGIALRASDIDLAAIMGYNWPASRGGPMFWADEVGLDRIVGKLDQMRDEGVSTYNPSALLRDTARKRKRLTEMGVFGS